MTNSIENQCYLIERGVRPCFMEAIQIKRRVEIESVLMQRESIHYFFEPLYTGWEVLYVFKNPRLEKLLKSLPEIPETEADHALLGFLFGYDVDSICEFLENKQMLI